MPERIVESEQHGIWSSGALDNGSGERGEVRQTREELSGMHIDAGTISANSLNIELNAGNIDSLKHVAENGKEGDRFQIRFVGSQPEFWLIHGHLRGGK